MNGLIVFNNANDIIYQLLNHDLAHKIRQVGIEQGLLAANDETATSTNLVDSNVVLQIFSPLINSQRIMFCQFDNTYHTFQCENGLNLAFGDLLGYTFLKVGQRPLNILKRHLGIAIALSRYFYGANLFGVQANSVQKELFSNCLNCYEQELWDNEQSILLETIPRLMINVQLKRVVQSTLEAALEQLRQFGYQRAHALLFVTNKFVSMNSTKNALALVPADLVFLTMLTVTLQSPEQCTRHTLNRTIAVFMQGIAHDPNSGCVPCIAHISHLDKHVVLIELIEYANLQVASSIYDTFFVLQKIVSVQMQGDTDALKPIYESLETFIRQIFDAVKRHIKIKTDELDATIKKFNAKWENLRKMYAEYFKIYEHELLVRIESNVPSFIEDLKQLFSLSCCDSSTMQLDQLSEVAAIVEAKLLEFVEFLAIKAKRNISIEAYLEDFSGLIHFIYINRTSGLMIAPDLLENQVVAKKQLWNMIEFARSYLKRGQTTIMWKDKTFHYSYFLWFEDQNNCALKTVDLQQHFLANASNCGNKTILKPYFEPGTLMVDYYQHLSELCFPKALPGKVKCYELFAIHLGLVTATCAVEHARRLVATIVDLVGEDGL